MLGAVFLAVLLGSLLVGRYALSPGQLVHMLWARISGGAADCPLSDDKGGVLAAARRRRRPGGERPWRCPARRIRACSAIPWCRRTFWGLHRCGLRRGSGHSAGGGIIWHLRRCVLLRTAGGGGGLAGQPPVQSPPGGGPDPSGA